MSEVPDEESPDPRFVRQHGFLVFTEAVAIEAIPDHRALREERVDSLRLIASLDEPADEDVEAAWLAEVERRLQDVDRGTAKFEPWEVVRARIATRLRANRR
jgi:putative addiction module component (TIGR02574 family)